MGKFKRTAERIPKLVELLKGGSTMLIVMQDNPDPDAIAAAVALRELANSVAGARCSIMHGGTIGRAENRELVHYLELHLRMPGEIDRKDFDLIALVDTQPGTGNNSLPPAVIPDIVVDHHPIRRATRSANFTDVRSSYGATATILCEYLEHLNIVPETSLATALLYGIVSDTHDLGTELSQADIQAMERLYPLANKRMLRQIERGRVPGTYYQMLADAIGSAEIYGHCIVAALGPVDNPDMIGEAADLFLRHERAVWSLCYGFHGGKALLSVRTQDTLRRADEVVRRIVSRIGTGGGHATSAGGQIALKGSSDRHRLRIERTIRTRFLSALGLDGQQGARLVRARKQ